MAVKAPPQRDQGNAAMARGMSVESEPLQALMLCVLIGMFMPLVPEGRIRSKGERRSTI